MRVELEGGCRQILSGSLGKTRANFEDGETFTLTPEDRTSGWLGGLRLLGGEPAWSWRAKSTPKNRRQGLDRRPGQPSAGALSDQGAARPLGSRCRFSSAGQPGQDLARRNIGFLPLIVGAGMIRQAPKVMLDLGQNLDR